MRYNLFPEAWGAGLPAPPFGKDCPATAAEASSLNSTTVSNDIIAIHVKDLFCASIEAFGDFVTANLCNDHCNLATRRAFLGPKVRLAETNKKRPAKHRCTAAARSVRCVSATV